MPALVIKNLPVSLHQRLKEEAQKTHRSMTKEAVYLLEEGLAAKQQGLGVAEIPAPYQGKRPLTDGLIRTFKHKGLK